MAEYEVIKNIMNSNKINENDKVYYIEMFFFFFYTAKDLNWIWDN